MAQPGRPLRPTPRRRRWRPRIDARDHRGGGLDELRTDARRPNPRASSELRFREFDQYVGDARNWGLAKVVCGLVIELFNLCQSFLKRRLPKASLIAGGRPYPSSAASWRG